MLNDSFYVCDFKIKKLKNNLNHLKRKINCFTSLFTQYRVYIIISFFAFNWLVIHVIHWLYEKLIH